MKLHVISIVLCIYVLCFSLSGAAVAETQFVGGVSDGFRTYAIIQRNGVEYRTDQMGARFNQLLWNDLSPGDRSRLVRAYGWQLSRRSAHFGSGVSGEMADWINAEQGWTAAAEALKQRHAEKKFPTLEPVFGPDATLEIPNIYAENPEIAQSESYQEAVRLKVELQADYAVGKEVYDILVNANWEQVSIAVKTLSEPLIKTIVDNFMTGFITNGASKVSELAATMYNFANDLKSFVEGRMKPGATPPTPMELIERLEQYIADMETTAQTAATLVAQKKTRLQELADLIRQQDAELTQEKKDAAEAVRDALLTDIQTPPEPAQLADFQPTDPSATPEEQEQDIARQAQEFYSSLLTEKNGIAARKSDAVTPVVEKYSPYLDAIPTIPAEPAHYLPDVFDGFSKPYFEIMDPLTDVNQWTSADLPRTLTEIEKYETTLATADSDARQVIDDVLPSINDLHARALWLNKYGDYLSCTPVIACLQIDGLRKFDSMIDIIADPEKTVDARLDELSATDAAAAAELNILGVGVDQREAWIRDEQNRYDSLRFNFENSLSYVIAALTQLDRLHSGPYYQTSDSPTTCYDVTCLYTYSIDVDAIETEIQAQPAGVDREYARLRAIDELLRIKAEEETLIQRLTIAQNAHLNDAEDMDNFFRSIASRYRSVSSYDAILTEFESVTGKTIKKQYDLWNDLVPDITYYYLGSPGLEHWIRNASNVWTSIRPAIEKISGKTHEYYLLLDLYTRMEAEKDAILAYTVEEFDAFMTDTTIQINTYAQSFQMDGVWGVDYPAWQLVMKTRDRQERLNSLYRYGITPDPEAWSVEGKVVTPEGVGVPGVMVILHGYLTTSTITASDGSFRFDYIGSGDFTLSVSRPGYQIVPLPDKRRSDLPSAPITVVDGNVSGNFKAIPTAESGYVVAGKVAYQNGAGVPGFRVVLAANQDDGRETLTRTDGTYAFMEASMGTYMLYPAASGMTFLPEQRTISVDASVTGMDFITPMGNVNGDDALDLTDVVLALRAMAGGLLESTVSLDADVDGDGKIGLAEAVFALGVIAGAR